MTAQRRADDLAAALMRRGARVLCVPTLDVERHADEQLLIDRTRQVIADPPGIIVVTTGFGLRGWIETADASGSGEALAALLASARVLARGPKAAGALQQAGVRPAWVAGTESSSEILEMLLGEGVGGTRIAVQLDGVGDPGLVAGLRRAGAGVVELPVYRSVEAADPLAVEQAAGELAAGRFDAVTFTSAPGAQGWLAGLQRDGARVRVRERVDSGDLVLAAVGGKTAEPLVDAGLSARWPQRARLGSLVRLVVSQLAEQSVTVQTTAGSLRLHAQGAALAGRALELSAGSFAVLRLLASEPGAVVSREKILTVLPGDSRDPHSAEAAVSRLRSSLGARGVVVTVARRGYRIADPAHGE